MIQVLLLISNVDGSKISFTPVGSVCTWAEILAELSVWFALVFTCRLERSLELRRWIDVPGKWRLSLRITSPMVVSMERLSRLPVPFRTRLLKTIFLYPQEGISA